MCEPIEDRNAFRREPHPLPDNWVWSWQDHVFEIAGGSQPPASTFISAPLPGYVRLVQIRDYYSDSYETYVPESSSLSRCDESDVLVARYGASLGRICRGIEGCYNVALVKAVPRECTDNSFLYYLLQTEYFQAPVQGQGARSAQAGFNREGLRSILLPLPPKDEQRAIAEVLGALDDKIAANTKLAARIDDVARAEFLSLKQESTPRPLSDVAHFVNGKAFTKGASGTGRVVVRIAELNSGIGGSTVFSDAEVDDQHVARPGDILFAWSGSLTLHRWYRDEAIVNQHIFKVIPKDCPAWLVYELLRAKLPDFKAIAADKATTMGHIQRRHLDEPVLVPSQSSFKRLDPLMEHLWNSALSVERENLTLAATRDVLLPQLMSGKLRVKEAEKVAAGVV